MASILGPLRGESPLSAFARAAGAVGAYEQLSAMQDMRRDREAQRQRQMLVAQLTGRTMLGDEGAMAQLAMTDPQALQALQKQQADIQNTQAQAQLRQAELPQVQQDSALAERAEGRRKTLALRAAIQRVKTSPELYPQVRASVIRMGLAPEEALPETVPTADEMNELGALLDYSLEVNADPVKERALTGALAYGAEAYGQDSQQFKAYAARLAESEVAERQAKARAAQREQQVNGVNVPRGLSLIDPKVQPSAQEAKEARRVVSSIAPVVSSIRSLKGFVRDIGWAPNMLGVDKDRGKALAAVIQLQLKDAFELGALDAGSERFLRKMMLEDPTQFRQDKVIANLNDIERLLTERMRVQTSLNNFAIDLDTVTSPVSAGRATLRDGLPAVTPEMMTRLSQVLDAQGVPREQQASILTALSERGAEPQPTVVRPAPTVAPTAPEAPTAEQTAADATSDKAFVQRLIDEGVAPSLIKARLRARREARGVTQSARDIIEGR